MGARKREAATKKVEGDAVPFEALLQQLEGLVERLEKGELSLEDSLAAYEEGIGLVRKAQGRLDAMDARLEQLTRDGRVVPLEEVASEFDDETGEAPVDPADLRHPPPAEVGEFDDDTDF